MADPLTIAKIAAHATRAITDKRSVERKVLVGVGIALVSVPLRRSAENGFPGYPKLATLYDV